MIASSLRWLPVFLLLATVLISCDEGLVDPDESPLIDSGTGVVGTRGGVVYVGSASSVTANSIVVIPAGALTKPVEIRISAAPASVSIPDDPSAVLVRFEPEGLQFESEVAVGLSYAGRTSANSSDYRIVHFDPATGLVTDLPTVSVDEDAQVLFGATSHFSYFALLSKGASNVEYGVLSDQRNAKTYRTVTIGTQTWMADNLNFPNGNGACYGGLQSNCDTYGYHYNWAGARTACPGGWRLPSDEDWQTLERFLGVEEHFLEHPNGFRGGVANVGGRLKDTRLWRTPNEGANNETGFSALPGDLGYRDGTWDDPKRNEHAYFWTSTEYEWSSESAYARKLWSRDNGIQRGSGVQKDIRLSVRCLKN